MPGPGDRGGKKSKPKDAKGALRRILAYLEKYRIVVFVLLLCSFASSIGSLLGPGFAGQAIHATEAGPGRVDFSLVLFYVRWMLVAYLCSNVMTFFVNWGMMRVSRHVAQKMRNDVFEKLMALPVGYFDRNQAGDVISRVSYDIDVICTSLSTDVVQILTSLVTVVGSLVMMLTISVPLSACMLVTIPLSIHYTRTMGRKTRPLYAKRSEAYGNMNGFVEEMFSGQKTIQAYAYEDSVCKEFGVINQRAADAYYAADSLGMTMGPTIGFFNNLGVSLIGLLGALLYLWRVVNMGQVSSFVLYSRKFSGPINEIANIINELYSALAAAERVFGLLDEPEESCDRANAIELADVRGDVQMRHVCFGYQSGKIILHDLNLTASPGQTVAIVGPTGAGKTTIINLLMRFYDVNAGEILIDGHEVRDVTRKSLRKAFAMILQDTWVFRGTIYENIAYGKEHATREEVIAAAKAAHIHDYIMRLPQGYDTVLREDGNNISKGQKQLLTIARAMLYDTRILILDEATSNVDTNTEQQVQAAMRRLMAGKTCFVIAHRLSTIRNADKILVLSHGDVVEQGTHEELMQTRGFYHRLYAAQFD